MLMPSIVIDHHHLDTSFWHFNTLAFVNDLTSAPATMASAVVRHATLLTSGPLFEATKNIQRVGENAFTAALLISAIQAGVALYQYRSNPRGELIVPPGLTWGVENPYDDASTARILSSSSSIEKQSRHGGMVSPEINSTEAVAVADLEQGTLVAATTATEENSHMHMWRRPLSRLNKWLFLLLPWVSSQVNFFMQRNIHLFHIGFVMSLASMFGLQMPRLRGFGQEKEKEVPWTLDAHVDHEGRMNQKVVVIGDSLAVGLGCSSQFDTNKNNTTPMVRLEVLARDNVGDDKADATGPAFPQVLAHTLSQRLQCRVFWRSAGVDGGSVEDIEHFCLSVVEEEASKGHAPDFVVLLCGMNDLKTFVGNPFQASSAAAFQRKLLSFIHNIRREAPNCKVVLPALPIQMFHRNSILNIFPLALFLDAIVGFWDSQKKRVADHSPSHVLYVGLSAADIYDWYKRHDGDGEEDHSLIAADGVHPNKRCYSKWGETVGNTLADKLQNKGRT